MISSKPHFTCSISTLRNHRASRATIFHGAPTPMPSGGSSWRRRFLWLYLSVVAFFALHVFLETALYVFDFYYPQPPGVEGDYLSWGTFTYAFRWLILAAVNAYVFFGPIGTRYFGQERVPSRP